MVISAIKHVISEIWPMHVTILVIDQCSAASAAVAWEVFALANHFSGREHPIFDVCMASLKGRNVDAYGGQQIKVEKSLDEIQCTDLVVIPGFLLTLKDVIPEFKKYGNWLRSQHAQGAEIATMCTATFVLAENSMLDFIRVTTHWAFAGLLSSRHPKVIVNADQILSEDNRYITSAGSTATLDMMLYIIRKFAGFKLAHTCSRYLLIDSARTEQTCYVLWSMPKGHGDLKILEVQTWLEGNLGGQLVVNDVAEMFGFGVRNFKRRFSEATGYTPINYIQTLRLERAKILLETTNQAFDSITKQVGYSDSNSFRQLFSKRVGIPPAAYRKKFKGVLV